MTTPTTGGPVRLSNSHVAYYYVAETDATADAQLVWVAPYDCTIKDIGAKVTTAPTGAAEIFDVNKNGTTVFTTQANRPTIADGATTSTRYLPDITHVTEGDVITVDTDQEGSTTEGLVTRLWIVFE